MRYRQLGRTGLRVSEVGFGGAPLGIANYIERWDARGRPERESGVRALRRALEVGINYVDTAPGYGEGASEEVIGEALQGCRDAVVLATKTGARDPEGIRASVEASLRRLRTDRVDVLQFHGGWYPPEDVRRILSEGGLETYLSLRDEGKVRFLGFTAEGPSAGVSQLIAAGAFDVLQVRYNLMFNHPCDFINGEGVLFEAEGQGMGVVTMRTLTSGVFQKLLTQALPGRVPPDEVDRLLLGYVLSNPKVSVALVGMRRPEEVDRNNALSGDAGARLDLEALHFRFV